MSIILTEAAAIEVNRIIEEQNLEELKYVRIGVVGGGCSGFQYDFNFTDKFDSKLDIMQEQHGVGVVVDKKSDLFLDGTTVDFYSGLDKNGFMFDNPNAVKSWGCGISFSA